MALNDPKPELDEGLRADTSFALVRWPAVGGVPPQGAQVRLASLLARAAMSVPNLAERAGVPETEAIAFVNGCHWLGYLTARGTSASVPATHAAAPRPARGLSGLIDSIRTALRGVAAREIA